MTPNGSLEASPVSIRKLYFCIACLIMVSSCAPGLSHLSGLTTGDAFVHQSALTSVSHWERLAEKSAASISACLAGEKDTTSQRSFCRADNPVGISGRPVHIAFGDRSTAFGRSFREYLITKLIFLGHTVTDDPRGALVVYSRASVVARAGKQPLSSVPGTFSLLGYAWYALDNATLSKHLIATGVLADLWKYENEFSGAQVVITTSLFDGREILLRKTDGYFISDADLSQYVGELVPIDQIRPQKIGEAPQLATLRVLGD